MEPTMENVTDVLNQVFVEVRKMMASDLLEEDVKQEVLNFVKNVLGTKEYVDLVSTDLDAILADKKIDHNDIPRMIMVVLKLSKALPQILKLKNGISMTTLKYLFFGTIYDYASKKENELLNQTKNDEFRLLFTTLWHLVEFNPPTLDEVVQKTTAAFCCC